MFTVMQLLREVCVTVLLGSFVGLAAYAVLMGIKFLIT